MTPTDSQRRHRRIPGLVLGVLTPLVAVLPALAGGDRPIRLEVFPPSITFAAGNVGRQAAVTAVGPDGGVRDVTAAARFAVSPPGVAEADADGFVRARAAGSARLRVEALGTSVEVPLRVDSTPVERVPGFRHDVMAVLSRASCNAGACHGNLNGKGGFRLSLRGEDPAFDFLALTHDTLGRRSNTVEPDASLLLRKPTGGLAHEGGVRFGPASREARALRGWLGAGARDDVATAPSVTRLEVFPAERIAAAPSLAQQLVVTAEFTDGSRRDVTRESSFDVSDPTRAQVSAVGVVTMKSPGETAVSVRYLGGRALSRLAFLHDRPGFVWSGPPPRNEVDRAVFARLRALQTRPSPPATDTVFLRRAYLDAIGRLPEPAEARTFLADTDPGKRDRLVEHLINRPEFADFWALKWADLLRNEEKTMGEKGVWVFQRWLRDRIAADTPLDEFTRALLTARGSTWTSPATSFFRTNRDPETAAETVAQVFLGVRLQCARCHNHPFDAWTQNDYYGLAAYFGNVRRKEVNNVRRDDLDKHEINGDELVYVDGPPVAVQPRSGATLRPKPPNGPSPDLGRDADARDELAGWLTRGNRQFARNMANRVWFHLMGRGVVDPVDDFRESNPPSNPALLDALTDAFIQGGYRLRPLVALVMKSQTYQLASESEPSNTDDETQFSHASVRLLPAEVLLDVIGQALGHSGVGPGQPNHLAATQLAGARMGGPFLKVFGKPDRLLTCECERSESTTLAQAFQMINGEGVRSKLEASDNRIGRLLSSKAVDAAILEELTLASLSRPPTAAERKGFLGYVAAAADRRKAWEDVAWALVNSKEFLLRH